MGTESQENSSAAIALPGTMAAYLDGTAAISSLNLLTLCVLTSCVEFSDTIRTLQASLRSMKTIEFTWLNRSRPKRTIQCSVLNGLRNVPGLYRLRGRQIGNCACYFQDPVVCASAQSLLGDSALQQMLSFGSQVAIFANFA